MSLQIDTARIEQANYRHLVFDIAWFGLALVATSRFLSVYAIRVGATPTELGLITALPSLILLFSSAFGGWWRRRHTDGVRALRLPGFSFRLMFLLPAFTPFLPEPLRPIYLVLSVSVPALAQGVANVVFIDFFRDSVGPSRMPKLLSTRSLWFNIMLASGAVAFGLLLEKVAYPYNYQIMFVAAFGFAMLSYRRCNRVRVLPPAEPLPDQPAPLPINSESPWRASGFRPVIVVASLMHISFSMLISVVPLYLVQQMGATEGFMALFGLIELGAGALMSLAAPWLVRHLGNRGLIALMMAGTALAALVFAAAPSLYFTLIGAALSGGCWAAASMVGLFGFFSEHSPAGSAGLRHSTAYMQIIGLSAFIGPMLGSMLITGGLNIVTVLLIAAAMRGAAALIIDYPRVARYSRGALSTVGLQTSASKP